MIHRMKERPKRVLSSWPHRRARERERCNFAAPEARKLVMVDAAAHGCVALCSKGLDRDVIREFVYPFLLVRKNLLCVKTQATTLMFRGPKEIWAAPLDLDRADEGGVAFSPPDGASIAVTGGGGTVIAETATGTVLRRIDIRGCRVAWSRDGLLARSRSCERRQRW